MRTFAVLGTTEVHDGDRRVSIGGPVPRRLVAALVAAEGRPVRDDQLIESGWQGSPPADPQAALQVCASRLRSALGDTRRTALRRTAAGYQLVIAPATTDIDQFTAQTGAARLLSASGQAGQSLQAFDAALRLWRGDPFADLPADAGIAAARAHLQELRDAAEEDRAAARIAAGQAAPAVAHLGALVEAAPYRERRWELLVLGLYRCGRQAEALAALRRVRRLLAGELGVEPGPGLQRLEQQVLRQDPRLLPAGQAAVPGGAGSAADGAGPPPRIPRPLSSFLGRAGDLARLAALVSASRLVTVTGTAGVGKTRLAVEHAAARSDTDGPWLARLADVTDAAVLPSAIAAALGLAETAAATPDTMAGALRSRQGLVVLDNCEHLTGPLVPLVLAILDRAPGLRVVATSRVPLGIEGEQLLPLSPLPAGEAAALLADRIRAARPAWEPRGADLAAVRRVAAAMDGIPLALELAAARVPVLGLHELAARLGDRLTVLGTVPAGSLTPHPTLEAAIGWSVDLLPAGDRALLLRLWPFEGGFPLAAVSAGDSGLETLSSLVSRSLVVADVAAPPARYRLLEIMRAYCRGRDPAPAASQAAQAGFVRQLAARAEPDLQGAGAARAVRTLLPELPNIRAAIAADLAADPAAAVRTAGQLRWLWVRGGVMAEGLRLLRHCLDAAPDAPASDLARARMACAMLEYAAGNAGHARQQIAAVAGSLATAASPAGQALHAETLYYQGLLQVPGGDPRLALAAAAESGRISGELGLGWLAALAQMTRGAALLMMARTGEGRQELQAAARAALDCGIEWTAGLSELMLAQSMLASGDPAAGEPALPVLRRALQRFRREEDLTSIIAVLHNGPQALAAAGQADRARRLRIAVDYHAARRGMRLEQTYAAASQAGSGSGPDVPAGPRQDGPPSLEQAIALFEAAEPGSCRPAPGGRGFEPGEDTTSLPPRFRR